MLNGESQGGNTCSSPLDLLFSSSLSQPPFSLNLRILLCSSTFLGLLASSTLRAGDSPKTVRAVRIVSPPVIDGYLNDSVWQQAEPATGFTQRDPEEGKPASEPTEIRVLYDDEALYFSCMYFESDPSKIVARLSRRDDEVESDGGSIRIDSYHDHQTSYEFSFNAAGVKVDILQYDDAEKEDVSWDAVWDLEVRILPNGWSAEVKIPFRILRYRQQEEENKWGINFLRYISRKKESVRWAFTPKNQSGFISRFGHLVGLQNLPDPQQVELLPFVVGRQRYEPARSFQDRIAEFSGNAGLDVKYSLSRSFTLDATLNPDFGQVEADPAVLNLTTFETFYPEKRPFFIEGTQILRFTTFGGDLGPGIFYSRRIGRAISPSEVKVPSGGKAESIPQNTTILGAAKVNGKTPGGLSVGALQAVTQKEEATIVDSLGVRSEQLLEPLTSYSVVRLKQDVLTNSNVGTVLTSVVREGREPAITNGYDWLVRLDDNKYVFEGFFAHTHANTQTGERIRGSAGRFNFNRVAAEHWLWGFGGRYASRRYDINDLGFFFRPDGYTGLFSVTYKVDQPASVVRSYSSTFGFTEFSNMDGINLLRQMDLRSDFLFANYWEVSASAVLDIGRYDDRETRGTGLYSKPISGNASISVETDSRENVIGELTYRFGWDEKEKQTHGIDAELVFKPLSWMEWQVQSTYGTVRDQEAWVFNTTAQGRTASIFADRSTDVFDIVLRNTITFTRDLTLQFYGQIFLAKGRHQNYRQLVGTNEFIPLAGSFDDNFNEQSMNTNLVLRWEYLPGSTLFLVWSQAREGEHLEYFTSLRKDFGDTFRIAPSNVILLKMSYWLSL